MKILISNDDGIMARGIQTLAATLSEKHEVYICAPDRERSANGHALTLHKPIRVEELEMRFPAVKAFSISGTPSDCVKMALNALLPDVKFDLLVSGINHGPNLGTDVLYSGTVSAALEGAMFGLPSIATSLTNGYDKTADFSPGAEFISDFLPRAMASGFPEKCILNVNIPPVGLSEMRGIKVTELGTRVYSDNYDRRMDPRGGVYYWLAGEVIEESDAEESDVMAIRNRYISVSPVHFNLTSYSQVERLKAGLQSATVKPH